LIAIEFLNVSQIEFQLFLNNAIAAGKSL